MWDKNALRLKRYAKEDKNGNFNYQEAIAAAFYFQNWFDRDGFSRNQKGVTPNNLFTYS